MAKVTVNSKLPHYNILLEKVNDLKLTGGKNVEYTQVRLESKEVDLVSEKVDLLSEDVSTPLKTTLKTNESSRFGGLDESKVLHNGCIPLLYHHALRYEPHTELTSTGALSCLSGEKTGRSPLDKRTVLDDNSRDKVWWDSVNIPIDSESFNMNKNLAIDFINKNERIYVTDAFAGWDPNHRLSVRIVSIRAYHAIFMHNLLIVPNEEELKDFKPDFTIYNAGPCEAKQSIPGVTSNTSICINYTSMEMIILGSEYAGEMKKGILTLMMYLLPQKNLLPLHSSCNVDLNGNVTLFFGLSGTGKTTLSTEPNRMLIGDDEHVWTENGVYNIEGGCYAKCKDLSKDHEPEIFDAIKFGSVLENVVLDDSNKVVNYNDVSITENTRCAYPLEYIKNVKLPALVNNHPNNLIFLTCDAFGALPPVSLLNTYQAIYHFVSGYTTKMVGTEIGVTKPTATFSACYAGPFLALSPLIYADLLFKKLTTDLPLTNKCNGVNESDKVDSEFPDFGKLGKCTESTKLELELEEKSTDASDSASSSEEYKEDLDKNCVGSNTTSSCHTTCGNTTVSKDELNEKEKETSNVEDTESTENTLSNLSNSKESTLSEENEENKDKEKEKYTEDTEKYYLNKEKENKSSEDSNPVKLEREKEKEKEHNGSECKNPENKLDNNMLYNNNIRVWLLNTGWIGGSCDSPNGRRIPLKYSRRIVDAINNDKMSRNLEDYEEMPYFGFLVPKKVDGVPEEVLHQQLGWPNKEEYLEQVEVVAKKFFKNFNQYRNKANSFILQGEPKAKL